jgi:K+-sensing histidine kinase KdpD
VQIYAKISEDFSNMKTKISTNTVTCFIFSHFYRSGEYSSRSIGLSIARTLVERMGGSIVVDRTLGVGSVFVSTHFRLGLHG